MSGSIAMISRVGGSARATAAATRACGAVAGSSSSSSFSCAISAPRASLSYSAFATTNNALPAKRQGGGEVEREAGAASKGGVLRVQENSIDIAPVGALTSKPYAFQARPWELRHAESIDVSDGVGSNIRVDYKETEVMRVLPRENEEINSEWIHDKARFSYDGLKRQRLDRPYATLMGDDGSASLAPVTWKQGLEAVAGLVDRPTAFVVGRGVDLETAVAVKDLALRMGNAAVYKEGGIEAEDHPNHLKLADVDDADLILHVGLNARLEATMLNVRIRQRWLRGGLTVGTIGAPVRLTYDAENLGLTPASLVELAEGKHPFCKALAAAEKPLILYGSAVLERDDSASIMKLLKSLNAQTKAGESQDCVHLVSSHANDVGLTALHLDPLPRGPARADVAETFYLVDLADSALAAELKEAGKAVVYQGTHGDENLGEVDALLPGATFVEKEGTYVNTEGRPQRSAFVFPPPGIAREDWKIVRALGEFVGVTLPYSDDEEMEERVQTLVPLTLNMDELSHSQVGPIPGPPKGEIRVHETTLGPLVHDFYRTDAVSRASVTMAKTSALHRETASTWEF
ncbi:ND11 homolog, NADH dehydrogenase (ubiquinone) subunit 11 [Ectocarpus siliculosus]|uniref:ND11 homolog, NADH dehydrogenase (Ubiquinone) subunit 11 n=1 Tax=Ectocarpus siliculosus TaxID=2880 RepID=D8LJZ5_ECTSI|nr:ND11 homolog, NADH dehydrogenase (ubiquinone) subunit 11 [Ectocarpus siliculosus]|eukprot:CBN74464.1 ND11 homolog, NADH dehydrogenase (ubiquinone) subunit 11 [Ectocarpus siliculosus]